MSTPGWKRVIFVSLILATVAVAQDENKETGSPKSEFLAIPRTAAPTIDGKLDEEAWQQGARAEFFRAEKSRGTIVIVQAGRSMYFGARLLVDPGTVGLRINILDPITKVTHSFAILPSNAPRAPVEGWRAFPQRGSKQISLATAQLRFGFKKQSWVAEFALPLDLVEFARGNAEYWLSFELWDLRGNRPIAVYPGQGGFRPGAGYQPIRPAVDWGVGASMDEKPQLDPAILLLERIAMETSKRGIGDLERGPLLHGYLGWRAGRRQNKPLADLETRLEKLAGAYPDYVGLHANLAIVRIGRGDFDGALTALDGISSNIKSLADQPRRVMIRVEMLRNSGRFDEAIAELEKRPVLREEVAEAAAALLALRRMKQDWMLEQAMRAEDAQRDDLPRIEVKTAKGSFVVELFEDDAPNAVASVVSLAEAGYYDGTRIHWCSGGRRIMAGDPNSRDDDSENDGYGDPGYLVEPEPSRRLNWIYTVALVDKRDQRRSEGGTFMIHLANAPIFDGVATAVGRIIAGHDVLGSLEYGDEIRTIRVTRKRSHAYKVAKRRR